VDKISYWNRYVAKVTRTREPTIYDLKNWLEECLITDLNPYAIQYDRGDLKPKEKQADKNVNLKQSTVFNTIAVEQIQAQQKSEVQEGRTSDSVKVEQFCDFCKKGEQVTV
jgi:hypothetical protein